jgi:hypothetical protein
MSMDDEEVGQVLRDLLAASDPVPPPSMQAACEAIGWRDPDSELARLAAEPAAAHLRGGQPRLLTFSSGGLVVDLEVAEAADGSVRLVGQLDPPHAADVTVESAGGARRLRADDQGRFAAEGLPDGWMRVVVVSGAGRTATEWFLP